MHKKKDSKSISYIQGLRPISSTIPRGLKGVLKKGGYNFTSVVDNWVRIVGKKISNDCYPTKINTSKNLENGILTLAIKHGKEVDIEYEKMNIIDKINSFFGYKYISSLKINVASQLNLKSKMINDKPLDEKNFEINGIGNEDLKKNLKSLVKAFNEKNN